MRFVNLPHVTVVGLYCSPKVPQEHLGLTLSELLNKQSLHSSACLFIGDFNVNWFNQSKRVTLYDIFTRNHYRQIVSCATNNSKTCIDLIFTNLPEMQISFLILETYFSDHKGVCALINCF